MGSIPPTRPIPNIPSPPSLDAIAAQRDTEWMKTQINYLARTEGFMIEAKAATDKIVAGVAAMEKGTRSTERLTLANAVIAGIILVATILQLVGIHR